MKGRNGWGFGESMHFASRKIKETKSGDPDKKKDSSQSKEVRKVWGTGKRAKHADESKEKK